MQALSHRRCSALQVWGSALRYLEKTLLHTLLTYYYCIEYYFYSTLLVITIFKTSIQAFMRKQVTQHETCFPLYDLV